MITTELYEVVAKFIRFYFLMASKYSLLEEKLPLKKVICRFEHSDITHELTLKDFEDLKEEFFRVFHNEDGVITIMHRLLKMKAMKDAGVIDQEVLQEDDCFAMLKRCHDLIEKNRNDVTTYKKYVLPERRFLNVY